MVRVRSGRQVRSVPDSLNYSQQPEPPRNYDLINLNLIDCNSIKIKESTLKRNDASCSN